MPIPLTPFFRKYLAAAYGALLQTETARRWLSGSFRLDGDDFSTGEPIEFVEGRVLQSEEFARLLMIFDGGRVHAQNQLDFGPDMSPPGIYFTSVNRQVIHQGHKNRIGLIRIDEAEQGIFVESLEPPQPDEQLVAGFDPLSGLGGTIRSGGD